MALGKKIHNVRYALNGIRIAWREELSFKIQIAAAALALFLGWFLAISPVEWAVVVLLIGFVLAAEAFNTALEEFCDMVKGDPDPHIGKIKDLAAGAVLIASIAALIVGLVIFLPKLLTLFV
ncbi:diacylglycerol kinase family protein [Candidatus Kaiserbacteria bacterium]|nr:diacylglycerol kinase family protein [Candidatus Kaiserbacteria bacterium]